MRCIRSCATEVNEDKRIGLIFLASYYNVNRYDGIVKKKAENMSNVSSRELIRMDDNSKLENLKTKPILFHVVVVVVVVVVLVVLSFFLFFSLHDFYFDRPTDHISCEADIIAEQTKKVMSSK
jgi:quinol-cytochrome oxidoreductase complex cytochrome b subunit